MMSRLLSSLVNANALLLYPLTHLVFSIIFQNIPTRQDQFEDAVDAALRITDAFQPDLNTSKAKQVAVLEEIGNVSNVENNSAILPVHSHHIVRVL